MENIDTYMMDFAPSWVAITKFLMLNIKIQVSNGLAETVLDKSTALKHQRASNRLLGERLEEQWRLQFICTNHQ